jgi:hypothetical protein
MNLLAETSGYQPNNSVLLRALSNVKTVMEFLFLLYLRHYNPPLILALLKYTLWISGLEIEDFADFTTSLLLRKNAVQPQKIT